MSAWDTLHDALRGPLADACVRLDSRLTGLILGDSDVSVEFGDGYRRTVDLVVGADGIGSATRRILEGGDDLRYSGYVAFRGLEPGHTLAGELHDLLAERFTSFAVPGMQMLGYLVPGKRGSSKRGVNWVWYVNTAEATLAALLTGRSGHRYEFFLPPGELGAESQDALLALADRTLPEPFRALVRMSAVFMQPVFDLPPARMVRDRVVLIGDAAGTVRPHTASGTSKAFGDAAELAYVLKGWHQGQAMPTQRLRSWESGRIHHLSAVADAGVRLAARSSLGRTGPQFL